MQDIFDDQGYGETGSPVEPQPGTTPPVLWRGRDVALIIVGVVLVFILGFGALTLFLGPAEFNGLSDSSMIRVSAGLGALETVALVGSVYFLGIRRRGLDWASAGLRAISNNWLVVALLAGLVAIPLTGLIAAGVQTILGIPEVNPQLPFLAPGNSFSWFGAISMLLLAGILAPFGEELFFRAVIYRWLRDQWGIWPAILASSLVFGIVHVDPAVGAAAAVLGVILAWIYERSDSLWAPVLIHVLNNAVKIVVLYAALATGGLSPGG
jgi:membrane protease YdiL (CAAX protease family)